jgi:hypothetical protein
MGGAPAHNDMVGYGGRIFLLLSNLSLVNLWLMAMNLLRFITWQHLLLLPLSLSGMWSARRDPLVLALTAGLILPILASTILLAYQGHGWGYRYLHGVIGNACLLGGYGWAALRRRKALPRFTTALHLLSLLLVLPLHAVTAAKIAAPYANAFRSISAMDADIAVIDDLSIPFGGDLIMNRPDLNNRPVRLMASMLELEGMISLCRRKTVAFVGQAELAPLQRTFLIKQNSTPQFMRLRTACNRVSRATPIASERIQ